MTSIKKAAATAGTAVAVAKTGQAGLRMLSGKTQYKIKQNMLNLTGDYKIVDGKDKEAFVVDAALISVRKSLVFKDPKGNEVCSIKEPMSLGAQELDIHDVDGKQVATARRKGDGDIAVYSVKFRKGPEIEVDGDVAGKDYKIKIEKETVADVNKRMFTVADSYGVEVEHGEDDALVLAAVVALDVLSGKGGGAATDVVQDVVGKSVQGVAKQGVKSVTKSITKK